MKRIILFAIICILGSVFFAETAHCLPWPPEVDVVEVSFDYDNTSHSYDALTIKKDNSNYETVPEWEAGRNPVNNGKAAFIKSQTNRKIKVKFWMDRTGDYEMGAYATKISGTGIGNVGEGTVVFNNSQYSTPKVMTCSGGSVPGTVDDDRKFKWRWYASYIDFDEFIPPVLIGDSGDHEYYTVFDAPEEPMDEPWKKVLDYACKWAEGKSTLSDVAGSVTDGIYSNLGDTSGDIDYVTSNVYTTGYYSFHLTNFLSDISTYDDVNVNCFDVANLFNVFASALGISTQCKRLIAAVLTVSIDPIGDTPSTGPKSWTGHGYGWVYDSGDYKVYDACLRYENESEEWVCPKNLSQDDYESAILREEYNGEDETGSTTVQ